MVRENQPPRALQAERPLGARRHRELHPLAGGRGVRPPHATRLLGAGSRRTLLFGAEGIASLSQEEFFRNRFYPIGATLPVGKRARVDLYLMVFSLTLEGEWGHDVVLWQAWYF